MKYALILDKEHDFILTPGLKIELPTGNKKVFQGNGKGEWDIFLSSSKGFGAVRVMGSAGVRAPNDMDAETAQAHYSLQLDYEVSRYFVPFVTINAFTVLNNGKGALPLNSEGFDLINFGSPNAKGQTQAAVGGGFRSRVVKWGDLGFAYEHGIGGPRGLYDDRFTVDFVIRF